MVEGNKKFEFGGFLLETKDKILFQNDEVVRIPPKTCELLAFLIENAGRVLTKDELMERVWEDTFVEEANLTQHISNLRRVLGKDVIETIPRKGYRFIANVCVWGADELEITLRERQTTTVSLEEYLEFEAENQIGEPIIGQLPLLAEGTKPASRPDALSISRNGQTKAFRRRSSSYRKIFLAAALAAAVGLVILYFWFWSTNGKINSIAVLPFKTLATDESDDYLKFGMADSLITKLGNLKTISVRPTSSILRFAGAGQDSVMAGKELHVEAVLEGSVQRNKDRYKVSIQLIRTNNGGVIWAETFDESSANILNLQDSISEKIVESLALNLSGDERKSLTKRYTNDPEAYQLYLQGRFHWYKWSPEGFQKAIEYFQKAIEKDPKYALAYAGLADGYGPSGLTSAPKEAYLKSKEATLKALELDESLPEAHMVLGMIKLFYEWDRPAANEQFLHALSLSPNNALVHDCYSIYLMNEGKVEESILHSKRALELDPLSPYMNADLGITYYYAHQNEAALVHLNKALELDPNYIDALEYLAEIHLQKAEYAPAVAIWKKVLILAGEPEAAQNIAQAFDAAGYKAAVTKRIEQLTQRARQRYVSPLEFANNYARLGDPRQAMYWLQKAYQEKAPALIRLKVEPRWDGFRSDPEFQELMQKTSLVP